jgi:acyl-CoA dehydrogenase
VTTAVRKGDKYVINGSKCFITTAARRLVTAREDRQGRRSPRISAFVVPRTTPSPSTRRRTSSTARLNTATITFNDIEVPAENLLGEENRFKLAADGPRPGVAGPRSAPAPRSSSPPSTKERVQLGVLIAMHQAVAFMIADWRRRSRPAPAHLEVGGASTRGAQHAGRLASKKFAADSDGGHH